MPAFPWLVAAALCAAVAPAGAQDTAASWPAAGGREAWLERFAQMPEAELRARFLRCDREATERMLGFDEGVQCAMAWDAILARAYANDVDALLAWWRLKRRGEQPAERGSP